ncbi:putative conserved exported protein [Mycobacterium xenopi 3993]|nr:putative conserved exported protein [Mycobacterium xenopi 3993]
MRRLVAVLSAALCAVGFTMAVAPLTAAVVNPWFAHSVGNATQVISVVGVGGSNAKMDVYQRSATGWQPIAAAYPPTSDRRV